MKLFFLMLAFLSSYVSAAPYIVATRGAKTVKYTPIVIDAKKLDSTVAAAQKLFPGAEYFVGSDRGYPLTKSPVGFSGLWTYEVSDRLFYGIRKAPRVDGFKPAGVSNFVVFATSVSPNYPVFPVFYKAAKEFGAFLTTTNKAGGIYTDAVTIAVNGVELGTVDLPAFTATYVGVRDDVNKLGNVSFTPTRYGAVAPFVADGFYLELK